jgi:hypothetical protein
MLEKDPGYLDVDSVKDADEYQGRNVTDAWVEEAGQFPAPTPIDRTPVAAAEAQPFIRHLVGSAQLVKGWLEGDWTAVEGAFFDCWSEDRHVIRPFTLPGFAVRINWIGTPCAEAARQRAGRFSPHIAPCNPQA